MSYCRWSCMDGMCDLYVYDHCDGGTWIGVAGRRHDYDRSLLGPPVCISNTDEWIEREEKRRELTRGARLVEIGLPYDGRSWHVETHEEAAQIVKMLRDEGYNMPDDLEKWLRGEPDCEPDEDWF